MSRTYICNHVIPPTLTSINGAPSLVCGMPTGHLNRDQAHGRWFTEWPKHRAPGPSQIGNQPLDAPKPRHKAVEPWPDFEEALEAAYELSDHFTRVARQETPR